MKLEYIKPDLEELELVLEGLFLNSGSDKPGPEDSENPDIPVDPEPGGGDDWN